MSKLNTENAKIAVQVDCMLARMRAESRAILDLDPDAAAEPDFYPLILTGSQPYVESIFRQFVASCPSFCERSEAIDKASDDLVRIAIESRANEPDLRLSRPDRSERFVASFSLRGETNPNSPTAFDSFLIQAFDLHRINLSASNERDAIVCALKIQMALDKYVKAKAESIGARREDRIFSRPALHLYRVTANAEGMEVWSFVNY